MNTNLVNYYTELVKFSSDGRESRRVSEVDRQYRRLSECRAASLAESDDCPHDCPARRLLEDITVLDWLRAIDNRWEVILGIWSRLTSQCGGHFQAPLLLS